MNTRKINGTFKMLGINTGAAFAFALMMGGTSAVMAQQSYTFSNCTATGNVGPTQGMVTAAYALTNLNGSVTVGAQQGIQQFTVPTTGGYRIEAWGGQGLGLSGVGGRGAYISGEFVFTAGQVLKILVGQQAEFNPSVSYNAQYGGGGGSFVTDLANVPFVVAGGGGGNWTSSFSSIADAPVTTAGNNSGGAGSSTSSGGSGGSGGGTINSADGGAGITGNGSGTSGGLAFVNGGNGGYTTSGIGGFGGGGGTSSFNNRRCSGGGGYSGGGAAEGVTTGFPEGGGGGSYNAGANQVNTAGVNSGQGKVVISELCAVGLNASTNPICVGAAITLSTNSPSGISWSNGSSGTSTISVSPTVTTTYTVTGAGTGTNPCVGTSAIVVTVNPLPVLGTAVTPTLICVGGTASVTATGATTYTWTSGANGNTYTVNPAVNTTYTVSGSSIYGCTSSKTYSVKVNTNSLTVSASSPSICAGSMANLTVNGVVSYTWNNGSHFQSVAVSPTANTVYSVSGRDANYCLLSNTISLNVVPKPNVQASSDKPAVCKGESVNLTASGAGSYTWSTGGTGASISVSLPVDIVYNYSVIGVDANGCLDTAYISVTGNKCTGLTDNGAAATLAHVYPNPTTGEFVVDLGESVSGTVTVADITGRVVAVKTITGSEKINISSLAAGIYHLTLSTSNGTETLKVVKY